ncbi:MAG: response regulator transcription factor [Pseudobdellovibrionaceae bacterium]
MMHKILLIDDCEDTGLLVKNSLDLYLIHHVRSLAEAESALKEHGFQLVLIDVTLPDGNGFDFCKKLSQNLLHQKIPRILLTAKAETAEKVFGFTCGADDYITKPFHVTELRARVDRYLLRLSTTTVRAYESSGFFFDLEFQKCYLVQNEQKQDLGLTPTEFRLFLVLVKNIGTVLSRRELEMAAWEGHGTAIDIHGINTHIAHLRKKLGAMKGCLVSVYGQGYSFTIESVSKKTA